MRRPPLSSLNLIATVCSTKTADCVSAVLLTQFVYVRQGPGSRFVIHLRQSKNCLTLGLCLMTSSFSFFSSRKSAGLPKSPEQAYWLRMQPIKSDCLTPRVGYSTPGTTDSHDLCGGQMLGEGRQKTPATAAASATAAATEARSKEEE